MSNERKYYVLCSSNCKFESMTKEQILAAIAQAVETGEIQDVDTGFVTTIKEQNNGKGLKFWVGTQAEYNALETKATNCFYIITDDTYSDDINAAVEEMKKEVEALSDTVGKVAKYVKGSVDVSNETSANVLYYTRMGNTMQLRGNLSFVYSAGTASAMEFIDIKDNGEAFNTPPTEQSFYVVVTKEFGNVTKQDFAEIRLTAANQLIVFCQDDTKFDKITLHINIMYLVKNQSGA